MADVQAILSDFGADPTSLRLLKDDGPDLLPYATLVAAHRAQDPILDGVTAVYEWQGAPLLFLVDADRLESEEQLHRIRRLLAMRGDAPYLGVVGPGRLEVYHIALDSKSTGQTKVDWGAADDEGGRRTALARLGNLRPDATLSQRNWISNVVLNLLTGSISNLIEQHGVSDGDAISLVGRALFARFLADRSLLPADMSHLDGGARLFDDRAVSEKTSIWLDTTFNGDLLPLSDGIFARLPDAAYKVLGDILRRAPDGQLFLGWEERWDNLDFAHIPVGVLSQAYELYLRRHAPERQRREGGYYTPRPIADLLVRASIRGLELRDRGHRPTMLDPAAGAGVFLLTAFRELVAQAWRVEGARPDTGTLRAILYDQIVGFDIDEAALRFAALGLYLLSIELDPNPRPVDKLRFKNLRGVVLHRLSDDETLDGGKLGSLGPLVGPEHNGRYDLVIGNPPWASATGVPDWRLVRETVARIAKSRASTITAPPIPNECLDLPFVWRAMEWAKPGGQIAFALHARLLFQQGDGMTEARQALFETLDVTTVVNGVELRQTKVWPEITAPFCLLLATNRSPVSSAGFRLISPRIEDGLNNAGCMRIDALNAEVVHASQLAQTPEILKILFRGSRADLGLIERIRTLGLPTLESFWSDTFGTDRGHLRGSGNGYQKLRDSSRVRKVGDGKPGVDAAYLHGRKEVTAATFTRVKLDPRALDDFTQSRIHDPRSAALFAGPLLLVHEAPPVHTGRIGVAVSDQDVVFNQSFYGYSPQDFPEAAVLVRYLALVLGSELATWMALVTSGRFGVEREAVEKVNVDRIPLPDFRNLSAGQKDEIGRLFDRLEKDEGVWPEVNQWVARLYGLGARDLQVISDTLAFNLPFARNKRAAQEIPTEHDQARFLEVLASELRPWSARFGSEIALRVLPQPDQSPWIAFELRSAGRPGGVPALDHWEGLLRAADDVAASELIVQDTDRLVVSRLAQRRYWSTTQARLLAQRIAWSHLDVLKARAAG